METIYVGFVESKTRNWDVNALDENVTDEDLFNYHVGPVRVFETETEAQQWLLRESFAFQGDDIRHWYVPIELKSFYDNAREINFLLDLMKK